MRLISLAASYVQLGKRVRWREIAARMTCTNKGVSVLRERLKTLKKTYGTKLDRLPRCLSRSWNLSKRVSSDVHEGARSMLLLAQASPVATQRNRRSCRYPPPLSSEEAWKVVEQLFVSIPKRLVIQRSGRGHENVGELFPRGLSNIISAIGPITHSDVFLDVGAGVGNIVCQFALETNASRCIGIEIQQQLVETSTVLVNTAACRSPSLRKVELVCGDFRHTDFQCPTILYSCNMVFTTECKDSLVKTICSLPTLHTVALGVHPCPRHSRRCWSDFCVFWTLHKEVIVNVSWTGNPQSFYVFKRNSSCVV